MDFSSITFSFFLIFSGALLAAAYYVWVVPANQADRVLQKISAILRLEALKQK